MTSELHDFGDGQGPVPARRHINPPLAMKTRRTGGWVADTASVDAQSFLSEDVEVSGRAAVRGSHLVGKIKITGSASVVGVMIIAMEPIVFSHTAYLNRN